MKILKTDVFNKWYKKLDMTQKTLVDVRITRIFIDGNFGFFKKIENIYELKFKSGLRVYYAREKDKLVLLLNGGGKDTKKGQSRDILKAKSIYEEYKNGK